MCNKGVRFSSSSSSSSSSAAAAAAAAAAAGSGEYRVGASRVCDDGAHDSLNLLGVGAAVLVQFSSYL